jgi:hypothetical protein
MRSEGDDAPEGGGANKLETELNDAIVDAESRGLILV